MQKLIIFFILFCLKFSEASTLTDFRLTPKTDAIFKLEEILPNKLHYPWGMTFIDKQNLLITEKSGRIVKFNILSKELVDIEHSINYVKYRNKNFALRQGGLLDILSHNKELFFSYSHGETFKYSGTAIAKGKLKENRIVDLKVLLTAKPKGSINKHWGSRILIKNDKLYAGFGERDLGMIAQDPSKHPGSVVRINLDGSVPLDNPAFKNRPDWLPEIFQIGVRNPQGIAISPFDSKIYLTNHGAKGGDWFGIAKFGENYGWKILGWGGTNYSGTKIGPKWKPGFTKPIIYWVPSIAVSAMVIYKGNTFKEWNGDALITSLKDQSLRKIKFKENKLINEEIIFQGNIGRIRDIKIQNETGDLYLLSDSGDLWRMYK